MVLLGNLLSLVGCFMMVAIGLVKKKEKILAYQCVQFTFMGLGNLALGAVSGTVANLVGIVRNLVFAKTKGGFWLKVLFIAIQLGFTAAGWNGQAIEVLPIVATVLFVAFLDTGSDLIFKLVNMGCMVMWATYDMHYRNYVAFVCDILTIVSSAIALAGLMKKKEA